MIPFVQLTEKDLRALERLTQRETRVWLAVKFLSRNGWTTNRRQLENLTGLAGRHVLLILASLERKGFLTREFVGSRFHPPSRFRAQATIASDPGTTIASDPGETGSPGSATIQVHLPRIRDLTDHVRPSRARDARAPAREDDGRTDGRCEPIVALARELWPDVARPELFIARLLELAPFAPADKLERYLRHGAQTVHADIPLAVLCTAARWEAWQRRRKRAVIPTGSETPPSGERLSASELAELATRALKRRG